MLTHASRRWSQKNTYGGGQPKRVEVFSQLCEKTRGISRPAAGPSYSRGHLLPLGIRQHEAACQSLSSGKGTANVSVMQVWAWRSLLKGALQREKSKGKKNVVQKSNICIGGKKSARSLSTTYLYCINFRVQKTIVQIQKRLNDWAQKKLQLCLCQLLCNYCSYCFRISKQPLVQRWPHFLYGQHNQLDLQRKNLRLSTCMCN